MRKTSKTSYKTCRKCHTSHVSHVVSVFIVQLTISALVISFIALFSNNSSDNVSALSYQNTSDVLFTFNPVINITIGGDLVIDNLAPGSYSDSNVVTITAGSNALSGYTLYATVGNDTDENPSHDNTNLTHTNGTNTFSSISTNKTNLSDFDASTNTWGYSYCIPINNTTTCPNDGTDTTYWINGDYDVVTPTVGYNALPLYTNTGIKLAETNNQAGESTIKFKIGARANTTQASGIYTNTINFIGVPKAITATDYTINYHANAGTDTVTNMPVPNPQTGTTNDAMVTLNSSIPVRSGYTFGGWCNTALVNGACSGTTTQPGNIYALNTTSSSIIVDMYAIWNYVYMQDLTLAACQKNVGTNGNPANIGDNITVFDRRDGSDYTVRYINGQCWMTQNLRITGVISAVDSNFTGSDFNVSQYSLDSNDSSYANHCDDTNGFNYVCSKNSSNSANGAWYNYCAASVGKICTSSSSSFASEDICPVNWHLPTGPGTVLDTDFNKLIGNTTSGEQSATVGLTAFNAVNSGWYINGVRNNYRYGYWWSATASSNTGRYMLEYDSLYNTFGTFGDIRHHGSSIRCVRSN